MSRSKSMWVLGAALLVALSGCEAAEDVLGVCTDCVEGVDFAVTDISVSGAQHVAELGRDVIAAGSTLDVTVRIENRGREEAESTNLEICVTSGICSSYSNVASTTISLPALGGGDSVQRSVTLEIPGDADLEDGQVRVESGHIFQDINDGNNTASHPLRVERPNLVPELELLASGAKVATGLPAIVRVTNDAYVAAAGSSIAHVCTFSYDFTTECSGTDRIVVDVGAIEPGGTFTDTVSYTVPPELLYRVEKGENELLGVCVNAEGGVSEPDDDNCLAEGYTARPNFEYSCDAGTLPSTGTVSGALTADDCRAYIDYSDFFGVEVQDGATISVTLDSYGDWEAIFRVVTEDGAELARNDLREGDAATFTIASGGAYYLVVSDGSQAGYSFSVSVD